jgi:hypothetical protein
VLFTIIPLKKHVERYVTDHTNIDKEAMKRLSAANMEVNKSASNDDVDVTDVA